MILQKMSTMMYCDIASVHDGKRKVSNMNFATSNLHIFVHSIRGTSILGEVRNVEIPGPTQQLLCSKYHDFLAIFALAHSKINQIV